MFSELETSKEGLAFNGFKPISPSAPAMPTDKELWRHAMDVQAEARKPVQEPPRR